MLLKTGFNCWCLKEFGFIVVHVLNKSILFEVLFLSTAQGWGHTVVQLVEALHCKLDDCGLDSRWCHWNSSFT